MKSRFALALLALATACVPTPEDPLEYGTLCQPATDECPAVTLLEREVGGRNQVDYIIRNVGDGIATTEVLALVPSSDFDANPVVPDELVARREHEGLSPDEIAENRFTAQDLGVRETFQFGVRCSGCDVELEFVFTSVPRECFERDDCPANWQCDENAGRCAECLINADCNSDQRCNLETGRCDPPDTTAGCATTSGAASGWVLLFAIAVLLGRRRRELFALPALLCLALPAEASPPRAAVAVSAGARVMSGKLGPLTKRGVGINLQQELRWRYLGAALSLGTSYFLTQQEPPPFSRSLQTYGVTLGPRVYIPIRFFELVGGADYRRVGTANNSLIRITGPQRSFNAVGGIFGARLRWSGLEVRLEGSAHHILQLETTQFGVDIGLGFTNTQ